MPPSPTTSTVVPRFSNVAPLSKFVMLSSSDEPGVSVKVPSTKSIGDWFLPVAQTPLVLVSRECQFAGPCSQGVIDR